MEYQSNKFEKLKKYDIKNPAAFNFEVLEISKNSKIPYLFIQHYLKNFNGNIQELNRLLGIKTTKHPNLPLMIFNYDHVTTPHDSLIGLECRGLVLNTDDWNIVAKPMSRFFNWGEIDLDNAPHPNFEKKQFNFNNFMTQSKEDGSLMVLYYYNGNWMLNTRTFFLNEVGKIKIIMSGINEVYVHEVLNTFISALDNNKIHTIDDLDKYLDKGCTYSFEFCSNFNKIVRTYAKDTVFLLAITNNETLKEKENSDVDLAAKTIGALRPKEYNLKTLDQIMIVMKEVINKDPSLEGFVIKDINSTRWKIKSPSYFFLHHIAYDQMRTPLPKDLVPIIIEGEGTELFNILEINGYKAELYEVQQQWKFCEERLNKEFIIFMEDWKALINLDKSEFEFSILKVKTPLKDILTELYINKKSTFEDLKAIWQRDPYYLVDKLFTELEKRPRNQRTAELLITHISKYIKNHKANLKEFNNVIIESKHLWWDLIEEENDGIAIKLPFFDEGKWNVFCYCGKEMNLFSVPEYQYNYKCSRAPKCNYCVNSIVDKKKKDKKLNNRSSHSVLTYQCRCGLSHRAHQNQKAIENERKRRPLRGKPLGIPCSDLCLIMRHRVHEEIDKLITDLGLTLDLIYSEASKILEVETENAHVGMIGISQCKKLIKSFQNMRGIDV